mgnify:CR=1 FL=1
MNNLFRKYQDIEFNIGYINKRLVIAVPEIGNELFDNIKSLKIISEKFTESCAINSKIMMIEHSISEYIEKLGQVKLKISNMITEFGGVCPICGNVLK